MQKLNRKKESGAKSEFRLKGLAPAMLVCAGTIKWQQLCTSKFISGRINAPQPAARRSAGADGRIYAVLIVR
jgi:hypothetical protein